MYISFVIESDIIKGGKMKKRLYPKTKRVSKNTAGLYITEKLDGSNIGFFNLNGELIIATRNNVFSYSELDKHENFLYKGMKGWLEENAIDLVTSLYPTSGFFGEWIGMGKIKYPDLGKRVYMFAKANLNEDFTIKNLYYDPRLFKYPFVDQNTPNFIDSVPLVKELDIYPSVEYLDELYKEYEHTVCRNVEGFVVNNNNTIQKYVRMKNGKLTPHKP